LSGHAFFSSFILIVVFGVRNLPLGRRVVDVLNFVELLYEKGIALYIQQFNMLTIENGKENPVVKMLLQMLSIGAEMENSQRKIYYSIFR
jgi:DNA invertase Pin-like site-specific DNA recombinase